SLTLPRGFRKPAVAEERPRRGETPGTVLLLAVNSLDARMHRPDGFLGLRVSFVGPGELGCCPRSLSCQPGEPKPRHRDCGRLSSEHPARRRSAGIVPRLLGASCVVHRSVTAVRRRRGAVVVETAVVLGTLLMVILGVLEFGRYVMMQQILNAAAREGA